jgi:TusA-related sulfurtransferase
MATTDQARTFDLRDLKCPANCVQIMAILEEEPPGLPMRFWIALDTVLDIPRMLRESGHEVRDVREVAGHGISLTVLRRDW